MEPAFRQSADRQKKILSVTWWGSIAALVFYLLLPWFVHLNRVLPQGESFPTLRWALWFVAIIQIGVVLYWMRSSLNQEAVLRTLRGTAIDPLTYYTGKRMAAIGMAQSVAVYGLALALVGGYFFDQYLLTLISGLLLAQQYPPTRALEELERKLEEKNGGLTSLE